MAIEYASSIEIPGCVLKPDEDTSRNFMPNRQFLVFVSGTMTGSITLYGIPSVILEDDDISDKSTYWTELEPTYDITDTDKAFSFNSMPGIVVQARAENSDAARYLFWGYANQTWGYNK